MALNRDCGHEITNFTMEMLGKLILGELKLIRKDMKEEINRLRCSMLNNSESFNDDLQEDESDMDGDSFIHGNENNIGYFDNTSYEASHGNHREVSGICERVFVKQEPITDETLQHDSSSNFDDSYIHTIPNCNASSNLETGKCNQILSNFDGARANTSEVPDTDALETVIAIKNDIFNKTNPDIISSNYKPVNDLQQSDVNIFYDTNISDQPTNTNTSDQSSYENLKAYDSLVRCDAKGGTLQKTRRSDYSVYKQKTKELSLSKNTDKRFVQVNANGEKHFHCKICGRFFNRSGNLKLHFRTHSGEKPYLCNICGKSFGRNATLKVHKRIHTGEKPYLCKICNTSFRYLQNLHLHERSMHENGYDYQDTDIRQTVK